MCIKCKAAIKGTCSQIRVKSCDTVVGLWLPCHLGLLWKGGRRPWSSGARTGGLWGFCLRVEAGTLGGGHCWGLEWFFGPVAKCEFVSPKSKKLYLLGHATSVIQKWLGYLKPELAHNWHRTKQRNNQHITFCITKDFKPTSMWKTGL